ncbi:MAG: hypothetical protein HC898_07855 [Phycisphaerales bacterium]|nr:hypothetical protein [Phycisphaerales bacterium]
MVNFTVAGTALRGQLATSDYVLKLGDTLLTSNSVTIPADAEFVDITVVPSDDTRVELTETVQLTLSASTTYACQLR